jgi:hypothetical protein
MIMLFSYHCEDLTSIQKVWFTQTLVYQYGVEEFSKQYSIGYSRVCYGTSGKFIILKISQGWNI